MRFSKFVFPILASLAFASPIEKEKSLSKRANKQFYVPLELRNNNFDNSASNWSYARSKSSQDFIVFWEPGFGTNPKNAPNNLRFDVDDVLSKAEKFFDYYTKTLKFVDGPSQTDKYKISIWIKYQTEWLATGSGYDNVVGALWVNPSTIQPVGGTIAHEIGHSFQYQVHCDGKYGFRDQDYVGTFWEICAQWMASRLYPEMFSNTEFELVPKNCWKHPLHENFRYQSILMEEYWSEKHGIDIVGKVWNGAKDRDDPIEAYKRVTNINQNQFIDEMFKVAQKNVLFDYKHLKDILRRFRSFYNIKLQQNSDGTYQIPVDQCTQAYGYVPVQLEIPSGGKVTVKFTGITGDRRYHTQYDKVAGWRYGFVAVKSDGESADYSPAAVGTTQQSTVTYTVPSGTKALWFVVMGAPTEHVKHHWKEGDNSGDEQFPWKVALSTCLKGKSCNPIPVDNNAPKLDGNQSNATNNNNNNNKNNNNNNNNKNNNKTCFSTPMGYPCCKNTNNVVATDCDGKWGVENGQWCGIGGVPVSYANCWAKSLGYKCCASKCGEVYATDINGKWSVENNEWCGVPK